MRDYSRPGDGLLLFGYLCYVVGILGILGGVVGCVGAMNESRLETQGFSLIAFAGFMCCGVGAIIHLLVKLCDRPR